MNKCINQILISDTTFVPGSLITLFLLFFLLKICGCIKGRKHHQRISMRSGFLFFLKYQREKYIQAFLNLSFYGLNAVLLTRVEEVVPANTDAPEFQQVNPSFN